MCESARNRNRTVSISMLKLHIMPTLEYEAVYVSEIGKYKPQSHLWIIDDLYINIYKYIVVASRYFSRLHYVHTLWKDNNETVVKMIATYTQHISSYGEYLYSVLCWCCCYFSFFSLHFKLKRIYFYCNLNNALKQQKKKNILTICAGLSRCVSV